MVKSNIKIIVSIIPIKLYDNIHYIAIKTCRRVH